MSYVFKHMSLNNIVTFSMKILYIKEICSNFIRVDVSTICILIQEYLNVSQNNMIS